MRQNEGIGSSIIGACLVVVIIVSVSFLFVMMDASCETPSKNAPWVEMKTTTDLNVRSYPVSGKVVAVLPEGTPVYVQLPEGRGYDSWARTEEENWVCCFFLTEVEEEYSEEEYSEEEYVEEDYAEEE